MEINRTDIAGFYRLALTMGLVACDAPVRWADSEILSEDRPDELIIDLSLSAGKPVDEMIKMLRTFGGPVYSGETIALLGCLIYKRLESGQLDAVAAARLLLDATRYPVNIPEAFDRELNYIAVYFEPWGIGPKDLGKAVRDLLRQFSNLPLPPV
jgi:hypothetical protein